MIIFNSLIMRILFMNSFFKRNNKVHLGNISKIAFMMRKLFYKSNRWNFHNNRNNRKKYTMYN